MKDNKKQNKTEEKQNERNQIGGKFTVAVDGVCS